MDKKQFKKTGNRIRQWWNTLSGEITHIDFSEETTKLILKVVVINFAVLAACSLFWFFGIGALVVYSIVLFFIIKKHYEQINKDYHAMLDAMQTIAEGNLDQEIQGDFGIFNPFRDELAQIQTGMKKAVEEEVKSQRMKTELITNVSHDLKTPLTAITTYIELLKKEDITEEERRSYIDTLERKSLRLKVLIEDLFEVSKANSNNIVLNKMELDVVNLIKQVSIEHVDKMKERGLELKWNVPEEKVLLMLDNQKTYRIFENLFVNVVKYAMQGSRVYLEVRKKASLVEIILKICLLRKYISAVMRSRNDLCVATVQETQKVPDLDLRSQKVLPKLRAANSTSRSTGICSKLSFCFRDGCVIIPFRKCRSLQNSTKCGAIARD